MCKNFKTSLEMKKLETGNNFSTISNNQLQHQQQQKKIFEKVTKKQVIKDLN